MLDWSEREGNIGPATVTGFRKMARVVAPCVGSRRRGGMEAAGPAGGLRQISDTGPGCAVWDTGLASISYMYMLDLLIHVQPPENRDLGI